MSDMNLKESLERFNESMKRAVSRARELAAQQKNTIWSDIANSLDSIRAKGWQMGRAKGRSISDVNADIEMHKQGMIAKQEESKEA